MAFTSPIHHRKARLEWINSTKALCMCGVYILHTLFYNRTPSAVVDAIISPFYVNAFFVISGILFFRKWLNLPSESLSNNILTGVNNTIFRLIIPTVLFSSLFFIPKLIYHSGAEQSLSYPKYVLGGISFWFTSAMSVTQLVMLITMLLCRKYRLLKFIILSIAIILLMPLLKRICPDAFPWYWKSGVAGISFMTFGGIIYSFRGFLKANIKYLFPILVCLYAASVIWILNYHSAMFALLSVRFNLIGTIITLSGVVFIIALCYIFNPSWEILQFIGENSIIFYFFSGIIPASLSSILVLHQAGSLVISLISILCGVGFTWIIVKYLPFLTDLRKLKWLRD